MEKQKMTDHDDGDINGRPIIIAMKGHPGSGKSTLAHSIAKVLKCPLIDKDHFRDCTKTLEEALLLANPAKAYKLLNDLSYEVICQVASTQLYLGLSVVIDSPLSRRAHLDRLLQIAADTNTRVAVVECKPEDEGEWRRRIEMRGGAAYGSSWHKPKSWQDMEKLLEGYAGCWQYDVGQVPKIVVDTTANLGIDQMVSNVVEFLKSSNDQSMNFQGFNGRCLS